jgi:DNA-binding MarR family transcriptional regulator/N-acetylglutamate synthase-like GNAT family acetyltransferase
MPAASPERVAAIRRFNRFYTRQIGALRKGYLDSPFSLAEARVLYELFTHPSLTASDIAGSLDLDPGYLSRVLAAFEKRGLISRTASKHDARQSHIKLTARGRRAFAPLEKRSQDHAAAMLKKLDAENQSRLVGAMTSIEALLGAPQPKREYILRGPRHGDFGWIVSRHAELYAEEYDWVAPFEGLCAQIVADYVNNYDPEKERVGCVMLVKDKEPGVARLRLLLVDPKARGLGLGTRLVDECIRFARAAGYTKMTLWTHSVLTAARAIYEKAGLTLTGSETRKSWSQDVVAEYWDLEL